MAYYFTFGSSHRDSKGRSLGNNYVKLEGSVRDTRDMMFAARGDKWSFQYDETKFAGQAQKYGLVEVSLDEVAL